MSNIRVTSEVLTHDGDKCVVVVWGGERCFARLGQDGRVQVYDSVGAVFTTLHPLTARQQARVKRMLAD